MHRRIATMTWVLATILGTLAMSVVQPAWAAATATRGNGSAPSGIDDADSERAPVRVDGRVLSHVGGLPGTAAAERAKTIGQRIEAIAADRTVAVESLRVLEMVDRTRVMAGENLVVGFIDADGAAEGFSRQLLAERALMNIKAAIAAYRNDRSPRVLLINSLYALGATALLAIALVLVRRISRKLDAIAEGRLKSRIERLEAQSHQLVQARQLSNALFGILKGLYLSSLLVAGYLYLHFVLFLYPWTRPLAARLLALILDPLQTMGLGLIESLPGLAFVAVVVIVTRYVLRLTRLYFESVDRGTVALAGFDREWALPTYKVARLIAIAFAVVVAYPYIPGSNSEAFKGVSIFLGLVVSLGSSSGSATKLHGGRSRRIVPRCLTDNLNRGSVQLDQRVVLQSLQDGRQLALKKFLQIAGADVACPHQQEFPGTIVQHVRVVKVRVLGDDDARVRQGQFVDDLA